MSRADITKVIPSFTDPKRQPAILKLLSDYAASMGFTPQEMQQFGRDRRILLMVYKAMVLDAVHGHV